MHSGNERFSYIFQNSNSTSTLYDVLFYDNNIGWAVGTAGTIDILGKKVISLVNQELNRGRHETIFDASGFSSGIYFYQLRVDPADGGAEEYTAVRKMVFIK